MNIETIQQTQTKKQINLSYEWVISDILSLPNINDNFYSKYKYSKEEIKAYQYYLKWEIIEKIEQYIQKIIPEDRDINEIEIINNIRAMLVALPREKRKFFIKKIFDIVNKFNTVRKYLDFENWPYKNPKELLCAMTWIQDPKIIKKIRWKIIVKQYWSWLIFFINDNYCYNIVITWWNNGRWNGSSWTYFKEKSWIAELAWTLIVINWNSKDDKSIYMTKHEWQHMRNNYFMPTNQLPITYAKDEIIAYLRDWRWIFKKWEPPETIENLLTWQEYQYKLEWKKLEKHKKLVKELLIYANDLVELTKDKQTGLKKDFVISMLWCTPTYKRKDLHFSIIEAVKLHNDKNPTPSEINKFTQQFFTKIKDQIWDKKLIKDLRKRWNTRFPDYSNLSNWIELRRALTAEKKSIINRITKAKSIKEIKYILEDLKYSNISRWPNNKWWIEISSIIDKILAWTSTIHELPKQIRYKVEELIKN